MSTRIEDYALIGDCKSAALVGRDGSIDWLCWPRFDSEACFAALLGSREHGRWLIAPRETAQITRRYRPNTLVLETHFETRGWRGDAGRFHAVRGCDHSDDRAARRRHARQGRHAHRADFAVRLWRRRPVGDPASKPARCAPSPGPTWWSCTRPCMCAGKDMTTVGEFTISRGETIPFVLTYSRSHLPLPGPARPDRRAWPRPKPTGANGRQNAGRPATGPMRSAAR